MKTANNWKRAARPALVELLPGAFSLTAVAAAANLGDADKQEGLAQLEHTRAGVVEGTKGLSGAHGNFKPGADRWPVAEVLEHITVTENFLLDDISLKIMQAPAGKADRDGKLDDQTVLKVIPDRSRKAPASGALKPTGRWAPAETLGRFLKSRAGTVEFPESTPDSRDHVVNSPIGHQWTLISGRSSSRRAASGIISRYWK